MKRTTVQHGKVLIITYVFPPAAWVGAHRSLKYCKYLSDHGWTPIVLTATTKNASFKDDRLLGQLPDHVRVHRTLDIDPAKWEEKRDERRRQHSAPERSSHEPAQTARAGARSGHRPAGRLKELLKTLLKDSPDSHIFWVPFAFFKGVAILLREDVDVVYCSSPPHSSHLIAFLLAKCFRKPYILDFRDPWYVNGSIRRPRGKLSWVLKLETFAKRRIVRGAAQIINVSKGERDELRAEFPEIGAERFTVITNGYDPCDAQAGRAGAKSRGKLTVIHAGTIYDGSAAELFEALHQLLRDHPGAQDRIQVQLVGEIAYAYVEAVRKLEAAGIVKSHGLLPHARTMEMIQESDLLLILMGGTTFASSHIPSKVFEYLHAEKPILAIAREGELAEIVRQSGLGVVVPPQSSEDVARALWELCTEHAAGRLVRAPNRSYIQSFERAALAEELAAVLCGVKESSSVRA